MSRELEIYEKMANGLKGDIRAMENEAETIDMEKHPYFENTLSCARTDLNYCEERIKELK